MKLSVIIPVLNAEETIARTLDSVLFQKLKDYEVVIVDGGSSDETLEIIQQHELTASLVSEEDLGISDALNKGVLRSKGEYLMFLNADDYWNPAAVSEAMGLVESLVDIDIFYSDVVFYNSTKKSSYVIQAKLKNMKYRMSLFHPCLIIKRQFFEKIGGYRREYRLAMDCEWLHRAISNGAEFRQLGAPLATMSLGGLSDVHFLEALREYRRSLLEHKLAGPVLSYLVFLLVAFVKALKRLF